MNLNKSFSIDNLSKYKKKIFKTLKKIQKQEVNVLSSIAFNKALLRTLYNRMILMIFLEIVSNILFLFWYCIFPLYGKYKH